MTTSEPVSSPWCDENDSVLAQIGRALIAAGWTSEGEA